MQMIPDNLNIVTQIKKGRLAAPAWLEHLAGGAQVEVNCLSALDSLIKPENSTPCLKAVIDDMTGMSVSDPNLIISSVVYVTSLAVAYEAEMNSELNLWFACTCSILLCGSPVHGAQGKSKRK